jgi:2-epi-5-epi-valiolone epimerase
VPIPTARNVDHFAYTVPDLDKAITLFGSVFGALPLYRQGPVQDQDGEFMRRQLNVHPRASCYVGMLRLGPDANLELFEYRAPGQRTDPPALSDVGGHELVFGVDELDTAVRWAAEHPDLTVLPEDGDPRFRALSTAWGMRLGLLQRDQRSGQPKPADPPDRMPGLFGVARVSYTVSDLALGVEFLTGALGGRLLDETARDDHRQTTVRLGPVTDVQLREYRAPVRTVRPRNSDVGGHHLAFYVDDVWAAARYLSGLPSVRLLGEPQVIAEGGPIDGAHWQYFLGPDGFQFEITHAPLGMAYEASTAERKFGPAPSWDAVPVCQGRDRWKWRWLTWPVSV